MTRKGGDRCKDRERVAANKQGDVIFSHAQIKCTWKTKDCWPRQKYVSTILGIDAHKDNTMMLAG